jgi:hypothetical protein
MGFSARSRVATLLVLDGVYRPPLGSLGAGLDRAIMHRAATATVRVFIGRFAEVLSHPASQNGSHSGIAGEPA